MTNKKTTIITTAVLSLGILSVANTASATDPTDETHKKPKVYQTEATGKNSTAGRIELTVSGNTTSVKVNSVAGDKISSGKKAKWVVNLTKKQSATAGRYDFEICNKYGCTEYRKIVKYN